MTMTPVGPKGKTTTGPTKRSRTPAPQEAPVFGPAPKPVTAVSGNSRAESGPETTTTSSHGLTSEKEYELDDSGVTVGKSTEHSVLAGEKTESEESTMGSNGRTITTGATTTSVLKGAEASFKTLEKFSAQERSHAIEMMARAGYFGEAAKSKAIKRGMLEAKLEVSGAAAAGIESKLSAAARMDRSGAIPAFTASLEASVKAGLWVEGKASAEALVGDHFFATIAGEIEAFAGAEASVEATVFASMKQGLGGEFEASAMAGVRAKGSVTAEIGVPHLASIEGGLEAEVMAGAKASASGGLRVSLTGISASFSAEAFAGAEASFTGSTSVTIRGRKVFTATGTVKVQAGVGGEFSGEFTLIDGKLKIGGALAGALGFGGGAEIDAELDFGAIADIIYAEIYEMGKESSDPAIKDKSPDYKREPLENPVAAAKKMQIGYDAVYDNFMKYAAQQVAGGGGISSVDDGLRNRNEEHIKKERVQAIIADAAPLLRADFAFVETDKGIEQAAREAFKGHIKDIQVQHGYIRSWDLESAKDTAQARLDAQVQLAQDAFLTELNAYCLKDANKETGDGITQKEVQKIITKHYKAVSMVVKTIAEADAMVGSVGAEMALKYLSKFSVEKGIIKDFTVDEEKVKNVKAGAASAKSDAAVQAALVGLEGEVDGYLTKLLATKATEIDFLGLRKAVAVGVKPLKTKAGDPEVDELIQGTVARRLGVTAAKVTVEGGEVTFLVEVKGGLTTLRDRRQANVQESKRLAAAKAFGQRLVDYRELKTGTGDHGMKPKKVQTFVDEALKGQEEWRASGDADVALMAAAKEALGEGLKGIQMTNGALNSFDYDMAAMARDKEFRKAYGTEKFSEDVEHDNSRVQLVTASLRGPFADREASFRKESAKDPAAVLTKAELQQLIDKAVAKIKADALTPAGDRAVADALLQYFPMINEVVVQDLVIGTIDIEPGWHAKQTSQKEADAVVLRSIADLRSTLGSLTPADLSKEVVQRAVDQQQELRALNLDADVYDGLIASNLKVVLADKLLPGPDTVQVVKGKVTKLDLKPAGTPKKPGKSAPPPKAPVVPSSTKSTSGSKKKTGP